MPAAARCSHMHSTAAEHAERCTAPADTSCFAAARTLAMVKPDAFKHLGKILNAIYESGFRIK